MATILWPRSVLKPKRDPFNIAPRTLAGPASISGVSQVSASDAGIWKATFADIIMKRGTASILAFRAISTMLEGRLHPILVPRCCAYQPFDPDWKDLLNRVPHSDTSPFSDGGLYRSRAIDIRLTSNIPLRGTTANIAIVAAGQLQPGQDFSVGERMYRIRTVQMTGENTATITFRPPAREAVAAETDMEFDRPVCRMRLATDGEMDLDLDLVAPWSYPTVNFIEDV
ncbi:hypothetical protein [Brucella pseudogrignonensis]|uniref:Uncharacterized protein n=1 Tax=Brucella pseudogrignonensis TaxID=419475 RepID=A0ABU1M869_9HYPH|nr:hypothetical protein [Brucella pseudogrignonensis]MDR6432035.1 hypothetical protein [Brucella pseudogrignonensis]